MFQLPTSQKIWWPRNETLLANVLVNPPVNLRFTSNAQPDSGGNGELLLLWSCAVWSIWSILNCYMLYSYMIILILIDQLILLLINLALAMFYYVLYPTTSQGYHLRCSVCWFQHASKGHAEKTRAGRLRMMSSPAHTEIQIMSFW